MKEIVGSIRAEYVRYQQLANEAMAQIDDAQLMVPGPNGGLSIATICWHVSGNLVSRFTDFLDADGEKPWRQREDEFAPRDVSRQALQEQWAKGWAVLFGALDRLTDADLSRTVTIRQQPLRVHEALHRSLAHTSYHVGQIVYLAKAMRGQAWRYLSIPPGQSAAYNAAPDKERPR
jgi:hypothetical protein